MAGPDAARRAVSIRSVRSGASPRYFLVRIPSSEPSRFTAKLAYSSFNSIPRNARSSWTQTSPTVPEPKNGSRTRSPIFEPATMISQPSGWSSNRRRQAIGSGVTRFIVGIIAHSDGSSTNSSGFTKTPGHTSWTAAPSGRMIASDLLCILGTSRIAVVSYVSRGTSILPPAG